MRESGCLRKVLSGLAGMLTALCTSAIAGARLRFLRSSLRGTPCSAALLGRCKRCCAWLQNACQPHIQRADTRLVETHTHTHTHSAATVTCAMRLDALHIPLAPSDIAMSRNSGQPAHSHCAPCNRCFEAFHRHELCRSLLTCSRGSELAMSDSIWHVSHTYDITTHTAQRLTTARSHTP